MKIYKVFILAVFVLNSFCFAQDIPIVTEKLISVNFKDIPISQALNTMFKGTGFNMSIVSPVDVKEPNVIVIMSNVPFDTALRVVLDSIDYTYTKKDNVYQIKSKTQDINTKITVTIANIDIPSYTSTEPEIEKIPLQFMDCIDVYNVLNGQPSNRAANTNNNSVGNFGNTSNDFGSNVSNSNSNTQSIGASSAGNIGNSR